MKEVPFSRIEILRLTRALQKHPLSKIGVVAFMLKEFFCEILFTNVLNMRVSRPVIQDAVKATTLEVKVFDAQTSRTHIS